MGEAWLEGISRVPNDHSEGGTYVADVPWRFVGHTTEVIPSNVAGAIALAGRHEYPPHLWAWPEKEWLCQTVRLDRSAFALLHPAGTPETNKMRAIQVEVIGYAKDSPDKPDSFWDWLGENVVKPVIDAGYAIDLSNVAPTTGTDGAGTGGAVRMTRAAWRDFDGLCVHANVPDNAHWDMGEADLARVAQAAGGDVALDPVEKAMLTTIHAAVVRMNQQLVPRNGVNVMTSGPDIGKVVPTGTAGSETVGDVWLWNLMMELERQGRDGHTDLQDRIAEKVVALLPPSSGGPGITKEDVRAVINEELGFLKPGQ